MAQRLFPLPHLLFSGEIGRIASWEGMHTRFSTRKLTALAMLTALNVVMAEVMKFPVIPKVLELSFGFLPIAVCGMLFGPLPTMAVAVVGDIVGALIFSGGDFFFGYTLTALLTGLFYGLFLHKAGFSWGRLLLCQLLVSLVCYAGLNTLWAYTMGYGRSVQYMTTRLTVNAVAYPVYVGVLYLTVRYRKTLERVVG